MVGRVGSDQRCCWRLNADPLGVESFEAADRRFIVVRNGFAAGAICCWIAKPDFKRIGLLAALALLAFGVFTKIVYWDVLPIWYHLVAIAFIIPVAMAGANLVTRGYRS